MAAFAFFLAGITLLYFSFRDNINFLLAKQDIVHEPIWRTVFYIHITGGILAITTGIVQFVKRLRNKRKDIHRLLGKIYVVAILGIGAPSGLYMAFFAEGGPMADLGFIWMSIFWFSFTFLAYKYARKKEFKQHSRWMVRSYALTFAAVTLRLFVPIASRLFGMNHELVIILSAWVSWILNLMIAEVLIRTSGLYRLPRSAKKESVGTHNEKSPLGFVQPISLRS